jgi:hypothetical protein
MPSASRALAAADQLIYRAADAIRSSRGNVQSVLLAKDDPKASLTELFARADAQLWKISETIPVDLSPDTPARLAELRASWDQATSLRDGLLSLAEKPRAERSLTATQSWFTAVGTVLTNIVAVSGQVAGAARMADPVVGEDILASQYAWAMRRAAGDEFVWRLRFPVGAMNKMG